MESRFDGTVFELFGVNLAVYLITLFTLGIAYPWGLVMKHNYIADHTFIDGHRVRFDGTGGQLFGIWIKIGLLTIITLGIYYFWAELEVQRWVAQHTHLEGAYTAAAPVVRQQAPAVTPRPLTPPPVSEPLPQASAPLPTPALEDAPIAAPVFAPVVEATPAEPVDAPRDPVWPSTATFAPAPVPEPEPEPEIAAPAVATDACAACGARLPENARFCQKCGSPTA